MLSLVSVLLKHIVSSWSPPLFSELGNAKSSPRRPVLTGLVWGHLLPCPNIVFGWAARCLCCERIELWTIFTSAGSTVLTYKTMLLSLSVFQLQSRAATAGECELMFRWRVGINNSMRDLLTSFYSLWFWLALTEFSGTSAKRKQSNGVGWRGFGTDSMSCLTRNWMTYIGSETCPWAAEVRVRTITEMYTCIHNFL